MGWRDAGHAWGAKALDWALLQEPLNANSFDALQQLTGVGPGVLLLDLACGSGLALQRAEARGAVCHGVDASRALLDVAALRAPSATLHCDDMAHLPYGDESFDVVERGERDAVALYRSMQDALDALESSGPAWGAIDHSGPEPVRTAVEDAVAPFVDRDSGRIVMRALMGHLVARKR